MACLEKGEGEYSEHFYEWRYFLFVCSKGGVIICEGAMSLRALIGSLEIQVESFPDAGKFVVRNIMVQGGDYDLRAPS
nr:hypothetical protein 348p1_00039 [Serratia grimesii]